MSDYYNKFSDKELEMINDSLNNKKGNRWQSKVVWASTFSLLLIIMGTLGLYEKIGITEERMKTIIDSILSILVIFGVLNNPTDSENF